MRDKRRTMRNRTSIFLSTIFLLYFFEIYGAEEELSSNVTVQQLSFRQYTCLEATDGATCELSFFKKPIDGWRWITMNVDDGCFVEMDPPTKKLYNFCPLQCPNATFAYIVAIRPNMNDLPCRLGYSVDVIRRRHDWFLRRSFACWFTDVQVDVNCAPRETENATHPEQPVRIRNRTTTPSTITSHDNSFDNEFLLTKRNEKKNDKIEKQLEENAEGNGEIDEEIESASGMGSGEMP